MNEKLAKLREKELYAGDIIRAAWYILQKKFVPLVLLTLLVSVPTNLFFALVPEDTQILHSDLAEFFYDYIIVGSISSLISLISVMAIAVIVEGVVNDQEVTIKESLQKAKEVLVKAIGTDILVYIILLGAFLTFILPGIYLGVYYYFTSIIVVLRNKSGLPALKYSSKIVKSISFWKLVGFVIIFGILVTIPTGLINFALESFLEPSAISNFLSNVIEDVVGVFVNVGIILVFLNIDYVKEPELKEKLIVEKKDKLVLLWPVIGMIVFGILVSYNKGAATQFLGNTFDPPPAQIMGLEIPSKAQVLHYDRVESIFSDTTEDYIVVKTDKQFVGQVVRKFGLIFDQYSEWNTLKYNNSNPAWWDATSEVNNTTYAKSSPLSDRTIYVKYENGKMYFYKMQYRMNR